MGVKKDFERKEARNQDPEVLEKRAKREYSGAPWCTVVHNVVQWRDWCATSENSNVVLCE